MDAGLSSGSAIGTAARTGSGALWLAGLLGLGACATDPRLDPPEVPVYLRPPAGEVRFLGAIAYGADTYECTAGTADLNASRWTFRKHEATLSNANISRYVGRLYAGPTWEAADKSTATGVVVAEAMPVNSRSIPWQLIRVTATTGTGVLTKATSIQRLETGGCEAPTRACTPQNSGETERIPCGANYYFYPAGS